MKYKDQFQATTTINEFLRFHTNPCNQNHANCRESRSNMRRFQYYSNLRTSYLPQWPYFLLNEWYQFKLLKVVAKVENPSSSSGATAVRSRPKSHTFTVNLGVFAPPQPRWRQKPWKGLFVHLIVGCRAKITNHCIFKVVTEFWSIRTIEVDSFKAFYEQHDHESRKPEILPNPGDVTSG